MGAPRVELKLRLDADPSTKSQLSGKYKELFQRLALLISTLNKGIKYNYNYELGTHSKYNLLER